MQKVARTIEPGNRTNINTEPIDYCACFPFCIPIL